LCIFDPARLGRDSAGQAALNEKKAPLQRANAERAEQSKILARAVKHYAAACPIVIETDGLEVMLSDETLEMVFYAVMAIAVISIIAGMWAVWRDVRELSAGPASQASAEDGRSGPGAM